MRQARQIRANNRLAREMRHARKAVNKTRRRAICRFAWKATSWTAGKSWTHRRRLAPLYIATGLQIGGAVAAAEQGGTRTVAFCGALGAVLLWWADRRNRRNDGKIRHDGRTHQAWPTFRRWYYVAAYAAAFVLLLTIAQIGAGPPVPGVLAAAAMIAGLPWWWHNRTRIDTPVQLDKRLLIWSSTVAGQVLPEGTDLLNVTPLTRGELDPAGADTGNPTADEVIGWDARIQIPPGRGTTATIESAKADIAACYDLPLDAVFVEPTLDRSARSARLLVLDQHNITHDKSEYDESWAVLVDGCYPAALFPDGTRAWRRLFKPGSGPVHEIVSGDTGSGKSRGMETGITQSVMTGLVIPFVADPQGGQSLPAWAGIGGRATWAATTVEEITTMLYATRRLMYDRSERLKRREWVDEDGTTRIGLSYHDPAVVPDMPIVEVTVDEAHILLASFEIAELVGEIAKMARKTGIRLRLGTQYPSITELGNSMSLRNQLTGNIVSYKIGTRVSKGMLLPDWAPNPFDIPDMTPDGQDTAGTCVAACKAPNGMRPTFQRGVWVRREHYWADRAAERIPDFGPADLAALGDDFATRYERADQSEQDVAAPPERRSANDSRPAGPGPIAVPAGRTVRARVLSYLEEHGRAHTGVVAAALDIPRTTTSTTLRRLENDGLVVSVRRGIWAIPVDDELDELETSA